jgi:hypothetical protein
MRHIVNFGLLFSFITLAVTGILSFTRAFSLQTTRIHIIFGLATLILVGLHLASRIPYFRQQLKSRAASSVSPGQLIGLTLGWLMLLIASFSNWSPVNSVIMQGYESRHRAEIVRPSPLTASIRERDELLAARVKEDSDTIALSIHALLADQTPPGTVMALWAETPAGSLIETLYISPELAYSDSPTWNGQETHRGDILPIWRHRYTTVSGIDPSGEVDAASGATENHSFSLADYLKTDGEDYLLFLEMNAPGDSNDRWTDPHLGQPSILYSALVSHTDTRQQALLELTGRSGSSETPGHIFYDMESITTAREMLVAALAISEKL